MKNIPNQFGALPSYKDKRVAKARSELRHLRHDQLLLMALELGRDPIYATLTKEELRLKLVAKLSALANGVDS
jgi:hypothetical protein